MSKIEVRLNPDVKPSGSDLAVVNAARRSFDSRSETLEDADKSLLVYLTRGMSSDDFSSFVKDVASDGDIESVADKLWEWRSTPTHDTPFNHCFISFEVKAPVFVARHLVKHEYLIMSEFSRRYKTDKLEFFEPIWRAKPEGSIKQGSGEEFDETKQAWINGGESWSGMAANYFSWLLDEQVSPEQARMVLPQSAMTEWTWSGTLGAFAKMCQLRLHKDAQAETREVAEQVYSYLKQYYPISAKLLVEGA